MRKARDVSPERMVGHHERGRHRGMAVVVEQIRCGHAPDDGTVRDRVLRQAWTDDITISCDTYAYLYCFEQP
jgi:hypothetical protein